MARVLLDLSDKLIEYQSSSTPGTLISNAILAGVDITGLEEQETDLPIVSFLPPPDYAELRQGAYASWGDQLDMQFHDLLDDTTTWRDHVAAVKAAHPKPD